MELAPSSGLSLVPVQGTHWLLSISLHIAVEITIGVGCRDNWLQSVVVNTSLIQTLMLNNDFFCEDVGMYIEIDEIATN